MFFSRINCIINKLFLKNCIIKLLKIDKNYKYLKFEILNIDNTGI